MSYITMPTFDRYKLSLPLLFFLNQTFSKCLPARGILHTCFHSQRIVSVFSRSMFLSSFFMFELWMIEIFLLCFILFNHLYSLLVLCISFYLPFFIIQALKCQWSYLKSASANLASYGQIVLISTIRLYTYCCDLWHKE
jgi:hypothetical protein